MAFNYASSSWFDDAKSLISSVTNIAEEEENFFLCLEYVVSNLKFHNNLDLSAKDVMQIYHGLTDKMMIQCKFERANNLMRLMENLGNVHGLGMSKCTSNTISCILHLFLKLSNSSESARELEKSDCAAKDESFVDWKNYLLEDIVSNCSMNNSSDWSEDESDEDYEMLHVKIVPPKRDDSGIDISADTKSVASCAAISSPAALPNVKNFSDNFTLDVGSLEKHKPLNEFKWLKENLLNAYWNDIPAELNVSRSLSSDLHNQWLGHLKNNGVIGLNGSSLMLHEKQIIREILWMLHGEDTFLFTYDDNLCQFKVRENIHVSHLTQNALLSVLRYVASHGDTVKILNDFINSNIVGVDQCCLTLEAYTSLLKRHLNCYQEKLTEIEKIVVDCEKTCSLSNVLNQLEPMFNFLKEIHIIHSNGINVVEKDVANHIKATTLLSTLYKRLAAVDLMCDNSVVLSIFLNTFHPYMMIVNKFIYNGCIEDPFEEFVLKRNPLIDVKGEKFWSEAFFNFTPKLPISFDVLDSVMVDMLVAGKSIEIITSLDIDHGHSLDINNDFIHRFKSSFKEFQDDYKPCKDDEKNQNSLDSSNEDSTCLLQSIGISDPFLIKNFAELTSKPDEKKSHLGNVRSMKSVMKMPAQYAITSVIGPLIKSQCHGVSLKLVKVLMKDYQLMSNLSSIWRFYCMEEGDVMFNFYSSIFEQSRECYNSFDLSMLLRDVIGVRYPEEACRLSINIDDNNGDDDFEMTLPSLLKHIKLSYAVQWPINRILTEESFEMYNKIFRFLLQIKHSKYSLDRLRFEDLMDEPLSPEDKQILQVQMLHRGEIIEEEGFPREQKAHIMHLIRLRLMNFVDTFHSYMMTTVLHSSRFEVFSAMEKACNVKQLMDTHIKYVEKTCKQCLCHPTLKVLKESIMKVLDVVEVFHGKWMSGLNNICLKELREIESIFTNCKRFLINFARYLMSQGSFEHFESLVSTLGIEESLLSS